MTLDDVWGSRPPGVDASTRDRSQGSDPGLPQPDGLHDSGDAPARTRTAPVNPRASASEAYPRLDPSRGTLTIPISTAVEALQSNEVYLPRVRQSLDPVLSARQINAISRHATLSGTLRA